MTPAVNFLKKKKVDFTLHTYEHDPKHSSFGLEAAEKLGLDPALVFKTLVVCTDSGELAVAILPVNRQLNLKALAKALGVKKTAMADAKMVESSTGYILGGVSPLAQKRRLQTVVDDSALMLPTMLVSGGKRGLDIELGVQDLIHLCRADTAPICS